MFDFAVAENEKREKRKEQKGERFAEKGVFILNDFPLLRIGMNTTI